MALRNLLSEALSGENVDENFKSRYIELLSSDMLMIVSFFAVA
ncbi:hypothetical protein [Terrimonas pollutisoli]|nr:hypothetical protein [Terrimonas sp. H1YJ31]